MAMAVRTGTVAVGARGSRPTDASSSVSSSSSAAFGATRSSRIPSRMAATSSSVPV